VGSLLRISTSKLVILIAVIIAGGVIFSVTASADGTIPTWVKSIAGWWSEGKVSDSDFIQAMQFLISQKIINIPMNDTNSTLLNEISQLQQQNILIQSELDSANSQITNLQAQLNAMNKTSTIVNPPPTNNTIPSLDLNSEKGLAEAWSEDKITDAQYIADMQTLIDQHKVMPYTETEYNNYQTEGEGGPPRSPYNATVDQYNPNQPVSHWIKNEAGFWFEGDIAYQDYRMGIYYLFEQGILRNPLH